MKILAIAIRAVAIVTMTVARTSAVARVLTSRNQSLTRVIATTHAGPSAIAIRAATIRVIVTRATSSCAT
jgi:hypothetical protein